MSTDFGEMFMKRLKKYKFRFPNQHLYLQISRTFDWQSIIANGRLQTGGTSEGNSAAQQDAWAKVLKFLQVNFER